MLLSQKNKGRNFSSIFAFATKGGKQQSNKNTETGKKYLVRGESATHFCGLHGPFVIL